MNKPIDTAADRTPTERPAAPNKSLLARAAAMETALEKLMVREAKAAADAATRVAERYKDKRTQLIATDPEAYDVMRDAHGVE